MGRADREPTSPPPGGAPGDVGSRPTPPMRGRAAATYATTVAVAGLSLVSVLITSRALGPTGRGEVAFLTTTTLLAAQLATLGVNQAAINFAGRDPGRAPAIATTGVLLSFLLGAVAAGVVGCFFAFVESPADAVPQWVQASALVCIPLLVVQVSLVHVAQAHYLFGATNVALLLVPAGNVVVNGTLAATDVISPSTAVMTWVGGQAVATVLVAVVVQRRVTFGIPDTRLARSMLSFGVRAHLGRVLTLGNYRLDQWLLGTIGGAGQLGTYSVAVAWSEGLFFLPTAMSTVTRPDLVRGEAGDARGLAARTFRVTALLTIPIAVVMVVAAPFLCTTVFGEEFSDAVPQLRVLALGALGIVALKLLGTALTAQRRPLRETAAVAVAFVAVIGLDLLLIPDHGGMGAAIASTVGYLLGGVAVVVLFLRTFPGPAADLVPGRRDLGTVGALLQRRLTAASGSESPSRAPASDASPPRTPIP